MSLPAAKPKVRVGLTVVELDDEAVVYDEESGDLHHLNPTATVVFGLCDGTSTTKQLSADISEAFGVSLEEIEPQVRRLVRQFRKAGLLEQGANGRKAEDVATR